jgi:hypothetical protein
MGVRRRISANVDRVSQAVRNAVAEAAEALADRSLLGLLMIGAGFLFALLAVLLAIMPSNLFLFSFDGTPHDVGSCRDAPSLRRCLPSAKFHVGFG